MRILANYGYKLNGDSYSVTFETMGDVPRDLANSVVDDLFVMAKSAIERQVNPEIKVEATPHKEIVVVPDTKNGNGKNGNGKPTIKDPEAPISSKQKNLIIRLAKERGDFIDNLNNMNMGEADKIIQDLLLVEV